MRTPQNRQEYLDELVRRSEAGLFPCVEKRPCDFSASGIMTFCMYRGENGRRCAYGVVIPDEAYQKEFEGKTPYRLQEGGLFDAPEWGHSTVKVSGGLFDEVQQIHDTMAGRDTGWNHEDFVSSLLNCQMFKGMKPTPALVA